LDLVSEFYHLKTYEFKSMRISTLVSFLFVFLGLQLSAQDLDFKYFKDLNWRNIGPAGMSGRITSIDVNLQDKEHILVGSASGGVWESKNGGISWQPIFDDQPTLSIGAVKFNQKNPDVIWVGTGEGNPRNSHNSGAGIFKSIDGGKTWSYMGLKETKLIHRIIVHAHNPDIVFVGALGSAWGDSEERGVYKTTDGGKSWTKVLYASKGTGIADLVVDPSNPDKLIAAMWEFRRTPWSFNSGGENSGIYLSYDAGENWKKLSYKEGLPEEHIGRVGLAFAPSKPNIVYALVESEKNGLYKSTNGGENWTLVSTKDIGNRPFYYAEIYVDPKNENRIYNLWSYVSRSEDGGRSFTTIMDYGNSVHPDHHSFWIDPDDPNYLINGNDGGLNISRDGAASWQFIENLPVGQFYHVDVDNHFPYNIYGGMQDNGSWVGPGFVLKSGGIRNYDWQELYFGDGFDVAPRDDSRYGYAMSQEGNLAHYDRLTGRTEFIQPQHPEGEKLRYNWNAALALDPYNDCGLYYGSQYVHYSSDCGKSWQIISPDLTTNDTIKQNQSKSGGLTLDITGAENHTTILAIAPSAFEKDLIYASTDDGRIHRTRDGGQSWTDLSASLPGMPENCWIPQIQLSKINEGELFVVVNNYRLNDWSAYLYHSKDYGKSWTRIVDDNDVEGFVCSVLQDPFEDQLLFLGTDVGLYFSLDYGRSWIRWGEGLPHVQIRDMKIQEQHSDLVLGTFGRSFWVLDDIDPLRQLASKGKELLDSSFYSFGARPAYLTSSRSYDGIRFIAQGEFVGDNKGMSAVFTLWKKPAEEKPKDGKETKESDIGKMKPASKKNDRLKVLVINSEGDTVRTIHRRLKDGLNRISWRPDQKGVRYPSKSEPRENSEPGGVPIIPGEYKVLFSFAGKKDSTMLDVLPDPRVDSGLFDPQAKYVARIEFNRVVEAATKGFDQLKEAKKVMETYAKIIAVQEDSIKKDVNKLHKETINRVDSLMHLYMLPEARKTAYRDDSHTLNSKLRTASSFLNTSTGVPTKNGRNAIDTARRATEEILQLINSFFAEDWKSYSDMIKELPLNIFKEFEEVHIK